MKFTNMPLRNLGISYIFLNFKRNIFNSVQGFGSQKSRKQRGGPGKDITVTYVTPYSKGQWKKRGWGVNTEQYE